MTDKRRIAATEEFSAAEIGALAHLYRGEVYRSTVWRTRLDTTTNWSVVTLGVALSITYSSPGASPLPLVLVGVLVLFFLSLEARRYRFFNVWRARARWIERHFYVPMLVDGDLHTEQDWQTVLANDYRSPQYHVSYMVAIARRVRSNYLWILLIQAVAYIGKLIVHPFPATSWPGFLNRADIGPIPGEIVLLAGAVYIGTGVGLVIWINGVDRRRAKDRAVRGSEMG
ncbi:DUF2270 domain-containing protein [Tabrizicola sp.]|uniref:DUF2270 domain-containing protein n=1 Tax=Tabrizicola sp. TaxID=2005166 RepID=UPI001A496536|nr:DUF2270 domain-containing protein [Tabrizicola sp.]MBL9073853.1 DUF2270 domain-containing protein [Tabrizicola sp.]